MRKDINPKIKIQKTNAQLCNAKKRYNLQSYSFSIPPFKQDYGDQSITANDSYINSRQFPWDVM